MNLLLSEDTNVSHQGRSFFVLVNVIHIQPQDFVFNLRIELVFLPLHYTSILGGNSGELVFCPLLTDHSWEN